MKTCRRLAIFEGSGRLFCDCTDECSLEIRIPRGIESHASIATERLYFLHDEIERKDAALDVAIDALDKLSKTGSLHRESREEAITICREARNLRIF